VGERVRFERERDRIVRRPFYLSDVDFSGHVSPVSPWYPMVLV
jgi:hypothetical protein